MKTMCAWTVMILVWLSGCGQDEVQFPDATSGGGCGEYYPGGAGDEGTDSAEVNYGMMPGDTFSCLVFTSVRRGDYAAPEELHLSVSEVYLSSTLGETDQLQSFFGVSDEAGVAKYLVLISVASHCPECASLVADLAEEKTDVEAAGILPVALANKDLWRTDYGLSLEESEDLLLNDGWPPEWMRTHDPDDEITSTMGAWPTTIGVRLTDMKVLFNDSSVRSTEDLLHALESGDAAMP